VIVAALLTSVIIGASVVEVPYYGIAPGDARPVQPRIDVEGAQVFSSEGEVLFVTVSVPRLTALGAVMGWLDPDVDVVEEERILGDQTPEENRANNLRLMSYSKDFATFVALDKLGYDVEVSDGGVAIDSLCMKVADDGVGCAEEAPAAATLQVRDLITAIDDREVNLPPDIGEALTGRQPGEQVTVEVKREGQPDPLELPVTLTSSEDGRTILGIIPNPLPPDTIKFEFPVTVNIDSGAVGGPSAGLAFTLALLDELTPGELTGGKTIAATGTITPSGAVGEIGGLPQKTVAVEREGAELFLVPIRELAEAQEKAKGTDLEVIGVETLDDALAALQELGGSGLPSTPARLAG
jgi:PDZ domain-containing protein